MALPYPTAAYGCRSPTGDRGAAPVRGADHDDQPEQPAQLRRVPQAGGQQRHEQGADACERGAQTAALQLVGLAGGDPLRNLSASRRSL